MLGSHPTKIPPQTPTGLFSAYGCGQTTHLSVEAVTHDNPGVGPLLYVQSVFPSTSNPPNVGMALGISKVEATLVIRPLSGVQPG
jgi:hypothetical protein